MVPIAESLLYICLCFQKVSFGLFERKTLFLCKKPGHIIADCPVLSKKQKYIKPVAFVKSIEKNGLVPPDGEISDNKELAGLLFFLTDGFVSLNSDPEIKCPIKIWRDTGAFQSVMLHNVLPFTEKSALGSHALVKGFGEGFLMLPLHKLNLDSELGLMELWLPFVHISQLMVFHSSLGMI